MSLDPGKETFNGTALVQIEAEKTLPLLWLDAKELEITSAAVVGGRGDDRAQSSMPAVRVVPGGESFAGFAFDPPLSPGRFILRLEYSGKISAKELSGLFREKEEERWYLYSQFESIDARRAFPCFDEPHYKVPWQFTLRIPRDMTAVSNTPIEEETTEGETKTVRFAETKPLPSYLLAFAVGPFDYAQGAPLGSRKVPFRVVTPKGQANRAKYTLETTPDMIKILEGYFGMPYPYDKLDLIAVPIFGGGMENAGCITFTRGILLTRPEEETPVRQRGFASIGAHEFAHMWFGDLVTTTGGTTSGSTRPSRTGWRTRSSSSGAPRRTPRCSARGPAPARWARTASSPRGGSASRSPPRPTSRTRSTRSPTPRVPP
jgi:alanyl aminopeptidase